MYAIRSYYDVIMNDRVDDKSCSYVAVDDLEGMKMAFDHLNSKGHTNIAYRCTSCKRTFRDYPKGVGPSQQSERLMKLCVIMSYNFV